MVDYIKLDEREFLYFWGGKKKKKKKRKKFFPQTMILLASYVPSLDKSMEL